MSWFKKAKQNKLSYDFKNQEMGLDENFGDIQRYVFDSYNLRIFLNKTNYKITISLVATHSYLGTVILSLFWSFDKDEESKARSAYREVIKICKETMSEFVKKEIPTNLFFPFIRKRLRDIRSRDFNKTNNPNINYSYDLCFEDDWRRTIYGPRYPQHKEESFSQYLNSSIYSKNNPPTGKFAL